MSYSIYDSGSDTIPKSEALNGNIGPATLEKIGNGNVPDPTGGPLREELTTPRDITGDNPTRGNHIDFANNVVVATNTTGEVAHDITVGVVQEVGTAGVAPVAEAGVGFAGLVLLQRFFSRVDDIGG
jgi:hypothetical protein